MAESGDQVTQGNRVRPAPGVPVDLARAALPPEDLEPAQMPDDRSAPASAAGGEPADGSQLEFCKHVHSYMSESIRFADQKASYTLAVATGLWVILSAQGLPQSLAAAWGAWHVGDWIGCASLVLLSIGVLGSIGTVLPRTKPCRPDGLVSWGCVSRYGRPEAYLGDLADVHANRAAAELAQHSHELAVICAKKYRMLGFSIWGTACGLVLAGILLSLRSILA
jgi:hypothetical protein